MRSSAFFVFAASTQFSSADLPVHCLRHQVVGEWEFSLTQPGKKRVSCGHQHPDSADHQPPLEFLDTMGPGGKGPLIKRKFSLKDPNVATGEDGSAGTWTMIYDEAFEVAVGDQVFTAFSKFEWVDGEKGRTNVSHCDQTEIGWYHNKARDQFGCYTGRKVGVPVAELQIDDDDDDDDDSDAPAAAAAQSSSAKAVPQGQMEPGDDSAPKAAAPTNAPKDPLGLVDVSVEPPSYKAWTPPASGSYDKKATSDWQQSIADALNFLQLGWTATTYGLFEGKTPRQMNQLAGVKRSRVRPNSAQQAQRPEADSFLAVASRVRRSSAAEVAHFDWRRKDGKSWIGPVVTQGDCGSCYTISTVHMLTARNKIRSGNPSGPSFSVSFPLYCSEYNQGCDGGYGFLQTKWSEDVGLVPEHCLPFSEGGGACQMAPGCDLGKMRYRATNHHYVGGYYGGSDADSVRKELVAGGPLVMSFEPSEDFMYYKNGVYKSGAHKIHQEWEQVDHAVLLVGYGADSNSTQYWTMQNSWGSDWGEDGFFRMARGIDESGCESIVVSADVAEESHNSVLDEFVKGL